MSFYPRRPRKREEKPEPLPAAYGVIGYDPPYGSSGEMIASRPEPPRPPVVPFVIEPWPEDERRQRPSTKREEAPAPALAAMKLAAGEADYDPPPLGPPVTVEPLRRFIPPEPNWRAEAEERERAARAAGEHELEPANSLQAAPAKPEPKPKQTPNLDRVKAMVATDKEQQP